MKKRIINLINVLLLLLLLLITACSSGTKAEVGREDETVEKLQEEESSEMNDSIIKYYVYDNIEEIQETLRRDKKVYRGYEIAISSERNVIINGVDTEENVDLMEWFTYSNYLPTQGGSWCCIQVTNKMYIVPKNYEGKVYLGTAPYVDDKGEVKIKKYAYVQLLEKLEEPQEIRYEIDNNGFIPYIAETKYFLVFSKLGMIEKCYLLPNVGPNILKKEGDHPVASCLKNSKILIDIWSTFLVFDIEKEDFEIVSKEILDYKIEEDQSLSFIDWNHREYNCKWWSETVEIRNTGKEDIFEFSNFELQRLVEQDNELKKIQDELKTGRKGINELELYQYYVKDGNYIDVNLPKAYVYNKNLMCKINWGIGTCFIDIDNDELLICKNGDVARRVKLPYKGEWQILATAVEYENENYSEIRTGVQLDNSIKSFECVLFLKDRGEVYVVQNNSSVKKILKEVKDAWSFGKTIYYIDSKGTAIIKNWSSDNEQDIIVAENVIGISKNSDMPGFYVWPEDEHANGIYNGMSYYNIPSYAQFIEEMK